MKNATYIALVVDRSGSIKSCLTQMQSAVNEFISSQRELEDECFFLLAEFDSEYDIVYRGPMHDAPNYTIKPRGGTALHDAIGLTINAVGAELADLDEAQRPDKVMMVIITDGEENSSREFTGRTVRDMVTHQTEKYSWNFDYLGANQDAVLVGESIGVAAANSMSFAASVAGTTNISRSLSSKAMTFRDSGDYVAYASADRVAAMAKDDSPTQPAKLNKAAKKPRVASRKSKK